MPDQKREENRGIKDTSYDDSLFLGIVSLSSSPPGHQPSLHAQTSVCYKARAVHVVLERVLGFTD